MADHGFWNYTQRDPNHLALVAPDGREWTRDELAGVSNQLVHGLRAAGLQVGDCVAAVLPNCAEFYALNLACAQAGWYLTPINWHLAGPEIAYIVADCEARVFIAHERVAEVAALAAREVGLAESSCFAIGSVPGFRDFYELTEKQPTSLPEERTAGNVMNYTSGTTGQPKGVRRPLAPVDPDLIGGLMATFLAMFGIEPLKDNVHLVGSPLYHTAVLMWSTSSLHFGHTVVLMDKWLPEESLHLIEKYRVTTSHMVPTQFHRLLGLPDDVRAKYDCSSTRHMVHAAAPCPPDTKRRMIEWWGDSIYEYYAATEGGGTIVSPEEWMKYPGTVGKAWTGADIRIYDDDEKQLPVGERGTVYMRLGQADFEYHKDSAKTRKNRIENYFTVGDIGYLNEEGYLFLCDRKTDMIISGGANIYPAEIENVFMSHPKVGDVAVFGIPHEDWGEEIKAVVEPGTGILPSDALVAELLEFCSGRLAKFKTPKSIDFTEEMPRDPNGKLYKRKLRDPYWEDRDTAI